MSRFLSSIWCDDIRMEVGNKFSYMGCYNGQMFVHALPVSLPKLCVALHAVTPATNPFTQIKFRLLNGQEILAEQETNLSEVPALPLPLVQSPGDELRLMVAQVFQLSPFNITEPCVLKVRAITDDGELKGGSLTIAVAPVIVSAPAPDNAIQEANDGTVAQKILEKYSPYLKKPE